MTSYVERQEETGGNWSSLEKCRGVGLKGSVGFREKRYRENGTASEEIMQGA